MLKKSLCILLTLSLLFGGTVLTAGAKAYGTTVDVDQNLKSDTTDARLILQIAAQKADTEGLDLYTADVDGDEEITTTDARMALMVVVGKLTLPYRVGGLIFEPPEDDYVVDAFEKIVRDYLDTREPYAPEEVTVEKQGRLVYNIYVQDPETQKAVRGLFTDEVIRSVLTDWYMSAGIEGNALTEGVENCQSSVWIRVCLSKNEA